MKKWLSPIIKTENILVGIREYSLFLKAWKTYKKMPGAEKLSLSNAYPCLFDRTSSTPIDAHYFYQSIWAMERIKASGVSEHVDVGSLAVFVGLLSTIVKVVFIDFRPLLVNLKNFESRNGTLLNLPFADDSVQSISCLHVAEHVGLGRYGDPIDPKGTEKAAHELTRILASNGHLYFSLPIGKPRLCFNAHRIHLFEQILEYFNGLKLVDFSGVTDDGKFMEGITPSDLENSNYACGMYHFIKN